MASTDETAPMVPTGPYRNGKISEEYATQFLGFSPISITDGIYNIFYDYAHDVLNAVQQHISQAYPDVISKESAIKGTEEILQKFKTSLQVLFDKLELYLCANILNVPEHVLLPEDEIHSSPQAKMDIKEIEQKINLVESEIRMERQRRACLIEEMKQQKIVKSAYEKFDKELDELKKIAVQHGVFDVSESLCFLHEQVKKMVIREAKPKTDS